MEKVERELYSYRVRELIFIKNYFIFTFAILAIYKTKKENSTEKYGVIEFQLPERIDYSGYELVRRADGKTLNALWPSCGLTVLCRSMITFLGNGP